jgi:hypothetical protein
MKIPLYILRKYVGYLNQYIPKFQRVSEDLYLGRCPFCGDSQRNPNKKRFYIYRYDDKLNYKCHNCGTSGSLVGLIREFNPELYKEIFVESFKESGEYDKPALEERSKEEVEPPSYYREDILKSTKICSELPEDHPARIYLKSRALDDFSDRFYFVPGYGSFCRAMNLQNSEKLRDDSRVVLVCRNSRHDIIGCIGRSVDNTSKMRYISSVTERGLHPFYGLDRVDMSKSIYVCEGAIDSLMIDNSVAVSCADLDRIEHEIRDAKDKCILIPDNERRQPHIMKRLERYLRDGWKVVMFPDWLTGNKDMNEMITSGVLSRNALMDVIGKNTYCGINGMIKFRSEYCKIKL